MSVDLLLIGPEIERGSSDWSTPVLSGSSDWSTPVLSHRHLSEVFLQFLVHLPGHQFLDIDMFTKLYYVRQRGLQSKAITGQGRSSQRAAISEGGKYLSLPTGI